MHVPNINFTKPFNEMKLSKNFKIILIYLKIAGNLVYGYRT